MNETIYYAFLNASFFENFVIDLIYRSHTNNREVNPVSVSVFVLEEFVFILNIQKIIINE
jgi:hypothetical protein